MVDMLLIAGRRAARAALILTFMVGYLALRWHQPRYDRAGSLATAVPLVVFVAVAATWPGEGRAWRTIRVCIVALSGVAACCAVLFRGGDGALLAAVSVFAMVLSPSRRLSSGEQQGPDA